MCENHVFNKKRKLYERKTRKERKIIMRGDFGSKLPKSPLFGWSRRKKMVMVRFGNNDPSVMIDGLCV